MFNILYEIVRAIGKMLKLQYPIGLLIKILAIWLEIRKTVCCL